jgi:hypothetical protein
MCQRTTGSEGEQAEPRSRNVERGAALRLVRAAAGGGGISDGERGTSRTAEAREGGVELKDVVNLAFHDSFERREYLPEDRP